MILGARKLGLRPANEPACRRTAIVMLLLLVVTAGACSRPEPQLTEADSADEARADQLARSYGPNHDLVAVSLSAKALDYMGRGMHAHAERLYRRSVQIREAGGKESLPQLAVALISLGGALEKQGNYSEAEVTYRRAIAVREARFGAEHAEVAGALQFLADVLAQQGRHADAEAVYARRLAICERACEPADLAWALRSYGLFLEKRKRKEEAQKLLSRSDELFRKTGR